MLLSYCGRLRASHVRIVLASSSPRRRQLIGDQLLPGVDVECVPSTFAEDIPHGRLQPAEYAQQTAREKANEVWARLARGGGGGGGDSAHPPVDILISADTVVARDSAILEKPASAEHARAMLESLSGRAHQVVTGVVIMIRTTDGATTTPADDRAPGEDEAAAAASASSSSCSAAPLVLTFSVTTSVTFGVLSSEMIDAYVASGEPFDKAGGYGLQSLAATFVQGIQGDYFNVVGLPLNQLAVHLRPHLERVLEIAEARPTPPLSPPAAASPSAALE